MSQSEQFWSSNENQNPAIDTKEEIINTLLPSFESIWESIEKQESIKNLYETFEWYIWEKLDSEAIFSDDEKNAIKIVMWWDFQNIFSVNWAIGEFMSVAQHKVQSMLSPLSEIADAWNSDEEKKTSWEKLKSLASAAEKMITEFRKNPENNSSVLEYLDLKIGKQVNRLKKHKQENPSDKLTAAYDIQSILGSSDESAQSNNSIFESIINETQSLWVSFEKKSELWKTIAESIDALPLGMWDSIKDWIKVLIEKVPLIGFILSMLMWEWFLDKFLSGENKKRMESFDNLLNLADNTNSPIAQIFPQSFKEDFDIKNLEGFFKYLESEKIDHSSENFWEELLTGKTTNPKIWELSIILKENYWEKILDWDDTTDEWAWLAKKLNSLSKLVVEKENQKSQVALNAKIAALPTITPIVTNNPNTDFEYISIDPSIAWVHANHPFEQDINTVSVQTESITKNQISPDIVKQYIEARNDIISQHIKTATSFPIDIDYGNTDFDAAWVDLIEIIDFKNGELLIGDKAYQINFAPFTKDIKILGRTVKQITVSDLSIIWNPHITSTDFMLTCRTEEYDKQVEKPLSKEEASTLILWLLEKWGFSWEIPGDSDTSKIPYTVTNISWNQNIS